MQKLSVELKNTPRNTPLVPCSVSSVLNKDASLSVQNKVLTDNSSEVDQLGNRRNTHLVVFVLNKNNKPLMPCKPTKAKHLLKQGKAKVVSCKPFTIKLLYGAGNAIQEIILGIDPGYKNIGYSAVSEKKELIRGEVKLRYSRNDVNKLLSNRREYRRTRRGRLWHRKPRFNNRVSSKKKRWLAPSINHKLDSHIRLVEKLKSLLPISKTIVEVANFDIQKIKNPNISGVGYQQGEQLGYQNIREYVFDRDNHICQKCKGRSGDKILITHHIRGKAKGATDRPEELLTVCKTCHERHHKGIDLIPIKENKGFKAETFMSIVRWKLVNQLNSQYTYGYITKYNRINLGIEKSHSNDAFVIADGKNQERSVQYNTNQIRCNNRKLQTNRKGYKLGVRKQRYKIQSHDLVKYHGKVFESLGNTSCGQYRYIVLKAEKNFTARTKDVNLYQYMKGMVICSTAGC